MNKIRYCLLIIIVSMSLLCPFAVSAGELHGTAEEEIDETELKNTPPSDYEINHNMQREAKVGEYLRFFLHDDLQVVEITLDETNLNYMLQHGDEKPSVMTDSVTIGGETIYYAGLKTKGNYTLAHTFSDFKDSDRFSFTINFGKYIKKKDYGETQNFYGVNKISFNNFFFDKSMMKEYVAMKLMTEMGVPTPAYGLAKLYINGEYYGVYFMVESIDSSILERFYGLDKKQVSDYFLKPEKTTFKYGDLLSDMSPLYEFDEGVYKDVEDMLPTVMEWAKKLNHLSEGADFDGNDIDVNSDEYINLLSEIMDIDETLRYFATHSFLVQMDNMFVEKQNFALYVDESGKSRIVPWDYDLSFGCYYPSTAEATANLDIDIMFKDQAYFYEPGNLYRNFPLFNVIYQNDSLREKFHEYALDCAKIIALGGHISSGQFYEPGLFATAIDEIKEPLIAAASEEMPSHVSYLNGYKQPRDVKNALPNLKAIIAKRAAGVWKQLNGMRIRVSGEGCNLDAIGNGINFGTTVDGKLIAVDPNTGMMSVADYDKNNKFGATLYAFLKDEEDNRYNEIVAKLGAGERLVYELRSGRIPKAGFTLYIPLNEEYLKANKKIYLYNDGELTELDILGVNDNIIELSIDKIGYIVIEKAGLMHNAKNAVIIVIAIAVVAVLGVVGFIILFWSKRRKAVLLEE